MDLIITHTSGDFDSLASLVAAKKIYPEAFVILPHSPEKQVREFLSLYQDAFNIKDEKHFDFSKVTRLIIVDTRLKNRLGRAASVLANKKVKIHIYDHHPRTSQDIKADKEVSRNIGATVTLLINEIKKRRINITPLEATVMGLGIYEDTGSLTFRTTTKEDIEAISYLFSRGLTLNIVSHYLNRQLTEEELSLLVRLIEKTQTHIINGVAVAISSMTYNKYIPDLALLTHRLIDIENFNVIFVLAKINSKIQMVARSSLPLVDVNKIANFFGGGGHFSAASCIIRKKSLQQVKKEILDLLKANVKPEIFAKDIMDTPVKTVTQSQIINDVKRTMIKFNFGGLPIVEKDKIVGIITRGDIDKAIYHGFGHSKVKGYMSRDVICINENTPIATIQKMIFENDIGYLPVLKNNKLIGIVTRNDILRAIHENFGQSPSLSFIKRDKEVGDDKRTKNLAIKMKRSLPDEIFKLLKTIAKTADSYNFRVYIVGGFVRDLILGRRNLDVDLVVEGLAIDFATIFARKFNAKLVTHARFGTAIIIMQNKLRIDVASSRTEFYEYPAALPTVELSSIKNDLSRRDFTINAMAIGLNKDNFGELIDFFDGQKDIMKRRIRVLHNLSFVEDPTRIFRAIRFEQRYDFKIDTKTEHLIKTAVHMDMFEKIAGERMRNEIIPILSEEEPLKGVKRMWQLHELRFIHKDLKLTKNIIRYFKAAKKSLRQAEISLEEPLRAWIIYFFALIDNLELQQVISVCKRLIFSTKDTEKVITYKKYNKDILKKLKSDNKLRPSTIYKLLNSISNEFLIMLLLKTDSFQAKRRIKKYLTSYRKVSLKICGEDLKRIGLKPSSQFKKILDSLLYAKLDKGLKNKKEEISYLKTLIEK